MNVRIKLAFTQQQYDTVLAALRFYQFGLDRHMTQEVDVIAEFNGRKLTAEEIDDLIEDMQTSTPSDVGDA